MTFFMCGDCSFATHDPHDAQEHGDQKDHEVIPEVEG
jgi:hypothetical protein